MPEAFQMISIPLFEMTRAFPDIQFGLIDGSGDNSFRLVNDRLDLTLSLEWAVGFSCASAVTQWSRRVDGLIIDPHYLAVMPSQDCSQVWCGRV